MATTGVIKLTLINDLGYPVDVKYGIDGSGNGPLTITYVNRTDGLILENAKLCDASWAESTYSFRLETGTGDNIYVANQDNSNTITVTGSLGGISIASGQSLTIQSNLTATIKLSTVMNIMASISIIGGTNNSATLTLEGTVDLGGSLTISDGITFTSTGSFTTVNAVAISANISNAGTFVYNGVSGSGASTIAKAVTIGESGRLETTTINHPLNITGTLICETIGDNASDSTITVNGGINVEIAEIDVGINLTFTESVSGLASLTISNTTAAAITSFTPGTFSNNSNLTITCNSATINLSGLTLNGSTFSATIPDNGIVSTANQNISLVNSELICKQLQFDSAGTGNAYSLEMNNYTFNRSTCTVTVDKNNNVFNGGTGTDRKTFTYGQDVLLISNFNIGPNSNITINGTLMNKTVSTLFCDGKLTVNINRILTLNGELNIANVGSLELGNTNNSFKISETGSLRIIGNYTLNGKYTIDGTVYLDRDGKIQDSSNTIVNVANGSRFYMNNGEIILSELGTAQNPFTLNIDNNFICNGTLTAKSPFKVTGGFHLTNDSVLTIAENVSNVIFGTSTDSKFYVTSKYCNINAPITTNMFRISGKFENNAAVTVNGLLHVTLDAGLTVNEQLEIEKDSALIVNGSDTEVDINKATITDNTTLIVNADKEILANDYAYGTEYKINPVI